MTIMIMMMADVDFYLKIILLIHLVVMYDIRLTVNCTSRFVPCKKEASCNAAKSGSSSQ